MPPVVDPDIERYALGHTTPDPPFLAAVAEDTRARSEAAEMMVGPVEGRLLAFLVAIVRPRLVVEVGTFTGYSALAMAAALPSGARLVTCEVDPDHAALARAHIAASPYADRIEVRLGPAVATLAGLDEPVDMAFIDADKTSYADYYEAIVARLSPHGVLAMDNVLWGRAVLDPEAGDAEARSLALLNDRVRADPRVECVLLTVRDGLTLVRRRPLA